MDYGRRPGARRPSHAGHLDLEAGEPSIHGGTHRAVPHEEDPLVSQRLVRTGTPLTDVLTADEVRDPAQRGDHQADHELGGRGVVHAARVAQRHSRRQVRPTRCRHPRSASAPPRAPASGPEHPAHRLRPCSEGRRTSPPRATRGRRRTRPMTGPRRHRVRPRGSRGPGTGSRRGARRTTLSGVPASRTVSSDLGSVRYEAAFDLPPTPHPGEAVRPDGAVLAVWDNGGTGVPVLVCNGLGTSPYAWPGLLDHGSGVRAVGWDYPGLGGSDRPRDPGADPRRGPRGGRTADPRPLRHRPRRARLLVDRRQRRLRARLASSRPGRRRPGGGGCPRRDLRHDAGPAPGAPTPSTTGLDRGGTPRAHPWWAADPPGSRDARPPT